MFFKQTNTFLYALAGLVLLNASCSKVEDLYQSPTAGESIGLIPDAHISAKFDWATSTTVDVRLAVNDQFDGKYTYKLEIFDREPTAAGAILLGAGLAKSGQDFNTKISIPLGLGYVYVQQTTPTGVVSYGMVEIKGNAVTYIPTLTKVAAVNARDFRLLAATTPMATAFTGTVTVPADATPLKGNADVAVSNKSYIVRKGDKYEGTFANGVTGATIYVEGLWDRFQLHVAAGNTVVVLPEGTVTGHNLQFAGDNATFTNYGQVKFWEVNIISKSLVTNNGNWTIANTFVIHSNGTFINVGTADVHMITGSGVSTVTNAGKLITKKINLKESAVLNVDCFTAAEQQMEVDGATVNIAAGARLNVKLLDVSKGGKYILQEGAMLDVKDKIHFSSDVVNTVTAAAGVKQALLRTGGLTTGYDLAVKYQGNLQVAISKHPSNEPGRKPVYTADPTVSFVAYDKVTVAIAGTSCNDGGINPPSTNPPGDQKLEEVILGTYSYAFEDNWPTKDNFDYDMNDFVVDVQVIKYQTKENKVKKVVLRNKIRALGASRRLAAGVQFDNIAATAVKSVTYSNTNLTGKVLPLTSTGVENGQQLAVVNIVDDAHAAFGYPNTTPFVFTKNGVEPIVTEITIEFANALDNFTYADLNPFIVNYPQNADGRNEIHLPGRKATDKINKKVIALGQSAAGELSPLDPFKTKDNYPFALSTPVSFQYPLEGQAIMKAYRDFTPWVLSEGATNQDWYRFPTK